MDTAIAKGLVDSVTSAHGRLKTGSASCIVFIISYVCPE